MVPDIAFPRYLPAAAWVRQSWDYCLYFHQSPKFPWAAGQAVDAGLYQGHFPLGRPVLWDSTVFLSPQLPSFPDSLQPSQHTLLMTWKRCLLSAWGPHEAGAQRAGLPCPLGPEPQPVLLWPSGPSCSCVSVSKHPSVAGSLCSTCPDPTPFWNPPNPLPGSQGVGGDDWTRYYLAIKKKTNERCVLFFFFLLAASKYFCFPNGLVGLPHPPLKCSLPVLLAPGAVELSQQHQLHGERLLSNLVTRVPKKLWKNSAL